MAKKTITKVKAKPIRKAKAFYIRPRFYGCKVGTIAPQFPKRRMGGLFFLDDRLTQDEMEYLFTVIGMTKEIEYR